MTLSKKSKSLRVLDLSKVKKAIKKEVSLAIRSTREDIEKRVLRKIKDLSTSPD